MNYRSPDAAQLNRSEVTRHSRSARSFDTQYRASLRQARNYAAILLVLIGFKGFYFFEKNTYLFPNDNQDDEGDDDNHQQHEDGSGHRELRAQR